MSTVTFVPPAVTMLSADSLIPVTAADHTTTDHNTEGGPTCAHC
jgi:hypothetical protein